VIFFEEFSQCIQYVTGALENAHLEHTFALKLLLHFDFNVFLVKVFLFSRYLFKVSWFRQSICKNVTKREIQEVSDQFANRKT
jgi:hypothetical protein